MKLIFILIPFVIIQLDLFEENYAHAQFDSEHDIYFLLKEGAQSKIAHFNRRNRPTGFTEYEVINVNEEKDRVKIDFKVKKLDRHEEIISESEFTIANINGEMIWPAEYLLFTEMSEDFQIQNEEQRSRDLILPAFLGNGMNLAPSFIEIENGNQTTVKVSDFGRTVNNFESIETPAGDFKACVIFSKREIQNDETDVFSVYTWISQGVGVVKTQYFNDRLRLVKSSKIVELYIPEG